MTARPIRRNAQTPDRNGKIFYTSTTSLSHISKVQRVEAPKRAKDLVQGKRKNRVLRDSLHQVRSRGAAPPPEPDAGNPPLCAFSDPDPLFSRNERSRCTKCTAASSLYFAFFGVASSKAAPSPLVRRPQVWRSPFRLGSAPSARQRPRHSYGDRSSGEALCAPAAPRQRGEAFACPPGSARQLPRLHRPLRDAHCEGGALARDAVHVNRRVMDQQCVFYDGEA